MPLSMKQQAFVHTAAEAFEESYLQACDEYRKSAPPGIELVRGLSQWFERGNINEMLGGNAHRDGAESGGRGRTILTLLLYKRNAHHRAKLKKRAAAHEALEPCINFLGSPDDAKVFFEKVLCYLVKRFSSIIQALKNTPAGISILAEYVAYRTLKIAMALAPARKFSSEKVRYDFLVNGLLTRLQKSDIPKRYQMVENDCEDNHGKWSTAALLFKSPIRCGWNVYFFSGTKDAVAKNFPTQTVTSLTEIRPENYRPDARF